MSKEKYIESNQGKQFIIPTKYTFVNRTNIVLVKIVHLVGTVQ